MGTGLSHQTGRSHHPELDRRKHPIGVPLGSTRRAGPNGAPAPFPSTKKWPPPEGGGHSGIYVVLAENMLPHHGYQFVNARRPRSVSLASGPILTGESDFGFPWRRENWVRFVKKQVLTT